MRERRPGRLRVGRMPYLNSAVFYHALPVEEYDLVPMPPRAMAAAVERGELDAGLLPLAEVLRQGAALRPVGDFCLATGAQAGSVLLFARFPAAALGGKTIAVTAHTATSIQLLRVLLADHWGVTPARYVELEAAHDAKLIIGDAALRLRHDHAGYPLVYDLGTAWRSLTGLPFVFAAWSARREVGAAADRLAAALGRSLEAGLAQVEAIACAARTPYLSADEAAAYVRSFAYRLGPEERRAIDEFGRRLARLPAWRPGTDPAPRVRLVAGPRRSHAPVRERC